ncbi:hypothetical protein HK27_02580 [Acetobacter orientalis]|uniref:Uncharacterized protein n=1 Tax=Acetobacter orientalis TaxID=146474 RepID=A0A252C6U1_9PROT|nr:hypothetical protein [Acetobacter orientalis]MDN6041460.1 hypothetical protein [Acetobacter sp.]MCP1221536.1 hypothetical protein [Acetobacter orientalis]OUI80543.1 hypothetical protein HK12_08315 [Acetobacter orientalis]OUI97505.1 hypothetical protein HK15_02665 [Acetobacter orientalis]OUJ16923.1 hypothetical protein HK27_02580 [Acetobacter orientalis]
MRSASVRVFAAVALGSIWSLTACAQSPLGPVTGEVSFHTHSADLGVGYTWGQGTLTYGGRSYPFTIKGAAAAAIGYSSGVSVGKVYNLQRVEDFAGTFWALTGEATVGRGVSGVLMENDNGVRIRLDYTRSGARFAASPERLTIKLDQTASKPLPAASKTSVTQKTSVPAPQKL